ncbi:hypothetical protein WMZ97_12580 [Lentibacillus sp. N15]
MMLPIMKTTAPQQTSSKLVKRESNVRKVSMKFIPDSLLLAGL